MGVSGESGFAGLRVATFESRLAGPIADLIVKHGGVPVEAPSLREVALADQAEALRFAEGLFAGAFDLVVFLTGVGTRCLTQAIETRYARAEWTEALRKVPVAIRGPKPLVPLRELGVPVALQAPEPNTWRELLAALDAALPVAGKRVAVQEYGKPNPEFIAGLEARGAAVTRVPVYRWALPEDTGPLRRAIVALAAGTIAAALFTSAQQVDHVLQVAEEEQRAAELRAMLERRVVVGSVGPATTEALRAHGLPVDIEPEHPKMGPLVAAVAAGWRATGKVAVPHQ